MNSQTQQALIKFAEAVEILTAATLLFTGTETTTKVMDASHRLKDALRNDETTEETR